jgi:hypothetical protein
VGKDALEAASAFKWPVVKTVLHRGAIASFLRDWMHSLGLSCLRGWREGERMAQSTTWMKLNVPFHLHLHLHPLALAGSQGRAMGWIFRASERGHPWMQGRCSGSDSPGTDLAMCR